METLDHVHGSRHAILVDWFRMPRPWNTEDSLRDNIACSLGAMRLAQVGDFRHHTAPIESHHWPLLLAGSKHPSGWPLTFLCNLRLGCRSRSKAVLLNRRSLLEAVMFLFRVEPRVDWGQDGPSCTETSIHHHNFDTADLLCRLQDLDWTHMFRAAQLKPCLNFCFVP
jgi:hypothetical protein